MSNRPWLTDLIEDKLLPTLAQLADCEQDIPKAQQLNHWLRLRWTERGFKLTQQQHPLMAQTRKAIIDRLGETHFSLRYIDFTPSESDQVHGEINSCAAAVSADKKRGASPAYTEHTQKNPKKHSSKFAFWSEDRDDLNSVLNHFPGSNQRDRVHAWIAWSMSQLKNRTSVDD